jgi:naphtho-gamma-pyrone polyketide synthase
MLLPVERSTKITRASAPKTSPIVRTEAQKIAPAAKIETSEPSVRSSVEIALLAIISAETGVAVEDLLPDTVFDDIGLDSLLALNITGRLREELDLTVESSLFTDCPTVKDLTQYFSGAGSDVSSVDSASDSSALSTPLAQAMTSGTSVSTSPPLSPDDQSNGLIVLIRKILAQEIGVKEAEIENSTILSDLGLDSLLSLTVLGQLREETDVDLPSDLFATCQSLDEVQNKLGLAPVKHLSRPINAEKVSEKLQLAVAHKSHVIQHAAVLPPATSVLLQGSPKTCSKRLFLFPDGSGSSTSYVSLAKIDPNVAVFGLNCPYMRKPEDMKCSLADLTAPYLAEIRRRQPHGPYYLGGWSAGGICAYDAVQELSRSGEEVARLILLDSPFPIGLEKLPPRLYDFFNTCGLFGDGSGKAPPSWLLPHFLAFIECLDTYRAVPLKSGKPKVFLIWAEDGVCNKPDSPRPEARADDPKEMKWLLNNRTDLGPNGWNSLVGDDRLTIQTMKDVNHFTMMNGKKAIELSKFLALAMAG